MKVLAQSDGEVLRLRVNDPTPLIDIPFSGRQAGTVDGGLVLTSPRHINEVIRLGEPVERVRVGVSTDRVI
jgi:hypothetical protein